MPLEKIEVDPNSMFYDPRMPDHVPVSHFEYEYDGYWKDDYFTDTDGYEFDRRRFS